MSDSRLLKAALAYAARGWPVFPCDPATKRPLLKNAEGEEGKGGVKKASTDEAQVRAWWQRWPRAMIGVSTGDAIGAFVLDLDAGTDPETGEVFTATGLAEAVALELGRDDLPESWIARTPRGGWHVYFELRAVQGIRDTMPGNRAGLIKRVDVRGNGGYVILPPSMRDDGQTYEWVARPSATEIAGAPVELLDCILRRGRWDRHSAAPLGAAHADKSRASGRSSSLAAAPDVSAVIVKYAMAALDAELGACASAGPGTRSDQLNASAFALGQLVAAHALVESEVRSCLEDVAAAWPNFPKSKGTIASGLRAGMDKPRDLSEIERKAQERASRAAFHEAPPPDPDAYGGAFSASPVAPAAPAGGDFGETLSEEGSESELEDDTPSDAPDQSISVETLQWCAQLDRSDTDNGKRLIAYFGDDLIVMEEAGSAGGVFMSWSGRHWDIDGGAAGAMKFGQRVGGLIAQEVDYLVVTPQEQYAIDAGIGAERELDELTDVAAEDRNDAQKARARELQELVAAGKSARAALSKRRVARRRDAVGAKNAGKIKSMLECAAPHMRRAAEVFNCDPHKIATMTHTLVFARETDCENPDPDGERFIWRVTAKAGHDRGDLITALVPVKFDGDAKPVKWQAFLDRFMPPVQADKRRTLQQYCGLGLLGIVVQHVMYHYGEGANGKSVFLETLMRVLGSSFAVSLPPETLVGTGDRNAGNAAPDIMRLFGKRMLRVPELKQGATLQEDLIKRITGGEKITARTLYKGYVDFQNKAKPHMSGNGFPKIDGTDHGIWRRMLVMHWTETIAKADQKEFEDVLRDLLSEADAILNWLIDGALDFLNNGFFIAPEVSKATESYRDDMDVVGQFRRACVVAVPADTVPRAQVQARAMFNAFKTWCTANAKTAVFETRFGREMKKHLKHDESGRVNVYLDVVLANVPEAEAGATRSNRDAEPPPPTDEEGFQ